MIIRKRGRKRKRPPQKKLHVALPLAVTGLLVVVCASAYGLYSLIKSRHSGKMPVFETHVSRGTEAKVKELDRRICDALLDLGVPAQDVIFNAVESRKDGEDKWTYSDLQVLIHKKVSLERLKAVFSERLSAIIPTTSMRFFSGRTHETILELSVQRRPTHRIAFVLFTDKKPPSAPSQVLPLVAIIIDDLGYDQIVASRFLELDGVLSFSVLPHSPFQERIAGAIHNSGREVLLHLPMQPEEYPEVDPGRGALLSSMGPDDLLDQLAKDLDAVPYIVGVNNHMGSRLTQDSAKMRQIFTLLKRRNLFFIDSLTSPRSRCSQAARLLQLRFAQRNVFLDHLQDPNAIRFQIKRLVSLAKTRGRAIGIGHPYLVTWETLKQELPNIKQQVKLVPISKLVG